MAEIAEIGKAQRQVPPRCDDRTRIEPRRRRAVGAEPGQADQRAGTQRTDGSNRKRDAPVDATHRIDKMRRRRTQRERPDEDADHQSHVTLRPGRCELHADRIDPGHADASDDTSNGAVYVVGSTKSSVALATAPTKADAAKMRRGSSRSARPRSALARQPSTKPTCTPLVSTAV